MKSNSIFYFLLVILINNALMSTSEVDFKKEGYYTVGSDKIGMDRWAIFDSSSFNKGDEIYFKITADYFNSNYLDFFFFDDAEVFTNLNTISNKKSVSASKSKNNKDGTETKYFKVKKNDENLGSLSGKYLVLSIDSTGTMKYENTKENEGKTTIIVVVVVVIIAVILIFCYCKRRKAMANMQGNNYNANVYNNNKNYNNNNYNNGGQNNYGQQQQYPNNQNYNMNMNNNNMQNNAYAYNNNQNAGNYGYPNQQYNGVPQSSNRYP